MNRPVNEIIGSNIKFLSKINSISITQLSDLIKTETRNMYRYLNGERTLSFEDLIIIAAFFKKSLDYFVIEHS